VTFPGLISCLSCFNASGVGAFINQGNCRMKLSELDFSGGFMSAGFAIMEALQLKDYDGDMKSTKADVVAALGRANLFGTYDIHIVEPYEGQDDPAVVFEARNDGFALRTASDDPDFGENILAVTNHHRILCKPINCWRYNTYRSMVQEYGYELNFDRFVELSQAVAYTNAPYGMTYHTMIYDPNTRDIWVAYTTDADHIAPFEPLVHLDPELLFAPPPESDDEEDFSTESGGLFDDDSEDVESNRSEPAGCGL